MDFGLLGWVNRHLKAIAKESASGEEPRLAPTAQEVRAAYINAGGKDVSERTILRYMRASNVMADGGVATRKRGRPRTDLTSLKGAAWLDIQRLTDLTPIALYKLLSRMPEFKELVGSRSSFCGALRTVSDGVAYMPYSGERQLVRLQLHQVLVRSSEGKWGVLLMAYEACTEAVRAKLIHLTDWERDDTPLSQGRPLKEASPDQGFVIRKEGGGYRIQPPAKMLVRFVSGMRDHLGDLASVLDEVYLPIGLIDGDQLIEALEETNLNSPPGKLRSDFRFLQRAPCGIGDVLIPRELSISLGAFRELVNRYVRVHNGPHWAMRINVAQASSNHLDDTPEPGEAFE